MLKIRMRRQGAKKDPHFRMVVTEHSDKRDGPFIEIVGHYHPRKDPAEIVFHMDRMEVWLEKGATMSDTVRTLYKKVKSGKLEMAPAKPDTRPGAASARKAAEAEEAAAAPEAEAPAEADETTEAAGSETSEEAEEESAEEAEEDPSEDEESKSSGEEE